MTPPNLRTLQLSRNPLLVRCLSCNHRATIPAEAILRAAPHEMCSITDAKIHIKCTKCGAKGRDIERVITFGRPSVEEWLSLDMLA